MPVLLSSSHRRSRIFLAALLNPRSSSNYKSWLQTQLDCILIGALDRWRLWFSFRFFSCFRANWIKQRLSIWGSQFKSLRLREPQIEGLKQRERQRLIKWVLISFLDLMNFRHFKWFIPLPVTLSVSFMISPIINLDLLLYEIISFRFLISKIVSKLLQTIANWQWIIS